MIDLKKIGQILLPDNQWHTIEPGSFSIEDYVIGHHSDSGLRLDFEASRWAAGDLGSKMAVFKEEGKNVAVPFGNVRGFKSS
jgi:hypothetical protein